MDVSLVIPVYNEGALIQRTVKQAAAFLRTQFEQYEIIVVDDGSTDDTIKQLKGCDATVLSLGLNYGKGRAVRTGMNFASGNYAFFTDADLSYPLEFLLRAIPLLQQNQVVCGQRRGEYPGHRKLASNLYHYLVTSFLHIPDSDTQCGIKGFTKQAYQTLFSHCKTDGFAFDSEVLFLARQLGYSIAGLPVELNHRLDSKVHMVLDGLHMAGELIQIRRRYEKGEYNLQTLAER